MTGTPEEPRMANEQPGGKPNERIQYPLNHVVAVLDKEEQASAVVEGLRSGGFLESEISVITGAAAAEALDDSTGRTGLTGLASRIADKIGIENIEMERKTKYENAMREGKFVVAVLAPSDERKERATHILRQHGAHTANYFRKFTIEGLIPPK
jgi:hypothetical protein